MIYGLFAPRKFRLTDTLPRGRTLLPVYGRFVPWAFRPMDVSPQTGPETKYVEKTIRPTDAVKQAVRKAATICPRPCELTFDFLTLKVVPESRATWATSAVCANFWSSRPFCSRLRPDVSCTRQTDRRQTDVMTRIVA